MAHKSWYDHFKISKGKQNDLLLADKYMYERHADDYSHLYARETLTEQAWKQSKITSGIIRI